MSRRKQTTCACAPGVNLSNANNCLFSDSGYGGGGGGYSGGGGGGYERGGYSGGGGGGRGGYDDRG